MNKKSKRLALNSAYPLLHWIPRILSVIFALAVLLFAFDAIRPEQPFTYNILSVLLHMVPGMVLILLGAVAWWRPFIGGILFIMLTIGYAYVSYTHLQWVMVISIPLLVLGSLFVVVHVLRRKIV